MKTPPRGKSKTLEHKGQPSSDPGKTTPDFVDALFGTAGLLFGFSIRGVLIILLWTWGWDLFLRPILEAVGTVPGAVLRAGDTLSRVGAAAHLARIAWREWGPAITGDFAGGSAPEKTPPEGDLKNPERAGR